MARRQRGKLQAPADKEWVGGDDEPFGLVADKCCECRFDRAGIARLNDIDLHPDGGRRRSQVSRNGLGIRMVGIDQQSDARDGGDELAQQAQSLCRQIRDEEVHAGHIAARPGKARDETEPHRISVAPNTMGMVAVAAFAARAGGVESATITAT